MRLRPILLTTFTSISALLPVAIGTTIGPQMFQPFAVTIIGGLSSGVPGTLIIVPTLATFLPEPKEAHAGNRYPNEVGQCADRNG